MGRKKTKEVAEWFAEAVSPSSAIACYTSDPMPGLLNFAIKGHMSFDHGGKTYIAKDIVNIGVRNNWWMGGPGMSVIAAIPGITRAAMQRVQTSGILPAYATFMTPIFCVSYMHMGIINLASELCTN